MMMKNKTCVLALLAVFAGSSRLLTATESHPKLLASNRDSKAVIIEDGKIVQSFKVPGICHDAWALKDGSVIACGKDNGVAKYKSDGTQVFMFRPPAQKGTTTEIHTCMPLADGHTLVAVNGTAKTDGKSSVAAKFYELDPDGKVTKEYKIPGLESINAHMQIRCARRRLNGEYLVTASMESKIIILNPDASLKRIIDLKAVLPKTLTAKKIHGICSLNNGNVLVGLGYGNAVVELNDKDEVVWQLTPNDVPELGMKYAAGVQRLPNGNTVVSASRSKYTLFEVTPGKEVVWKIPVGLGGAMSTVQVLSVPYDASKFDSQK